jgi:hypothetical protein
MKSILNLSRLFYKLASFTAEEFEIPLRDPKTFVTNYFKKISNKLYNIKNSINFNEDDEIQKDFFSDLRIKYDIESFSYVLNNIIDKLDRRIELSSFYNDNRILVSDLNSHSMYLSDHNEQLNILNKYISNILEEIKQYSKDEFEKLAKDYNLSFDYNLFFNIKDSIDKIIASNEHYSILLKNILKPSSQRSESQSSLNEPKTLYHATANATSIFNSGFKLDAAETQGIGGSTSIRNGSPGISFTSDLYVAKEIARCLKEAILIAKGYTNGYNILSWSTMPDEILKSNESINGKSDLTSIEGSFDLYKVYLALDPSRYDPLFFIHSSKMAKIFGSKNEEDVGIIVAKVNLSKDEYEYLNSMHEYRVTASKVISVEKIIK